MTASTPALAGLMMDRCRSGRDRRAAPGVVQRPVLYVVPKQGHALDAEGVLAFLGGTVPKWWLPDEVRVVAELPHTATRKVSKRTLRDRFAAASEGT